MRMSVRFNLFIMVFCAQVAVVVRASNAEDKKAVLKKNEGGTVLVSAIEKPVNDSEKNVSADGDNPKQKDDAEELKNLIEKQNAEIKALKAEKEKSEARKAAEVQAEKDRAALSETERADTIGRLSGVTNTLETAKTNPVMQVSAELKLLIEDLENWRKVEDSLTKLRVGYVSFAPYTIRKDAANPQNPAYSLDESGSDGSAFVEITFSDRFAWRTDKGRAQGRNCGFGLAYHKDDESKGNAGKNAILVARRPWDWEAKLGFIFGDDLDDDETSGSTISAGGDIYAELAVGYPLFYFRQDNGLQVSWNIPEVAGTWVTDKSTFDIHDSYKLCTALVGQGQVGGSGRAWRLLGRLGVGWVETPSLTGMLDAAGNPEVSAEDGQPKFSTEFGLATQVLFDIPLFEYSTVSLSGEFWNVDGVNPWSAFVSYSKSFSELGTLLNL